MKNSRSYRKKSRRSLVRKRTIGVLALIVVALAAAFYFGRGPREMPHVRTVARPRPHPVPVERWSPVQIGSLRASLVRALVPGVAHVLRVSAVVLAQNGSILYAQSAREPLTPASAIKLIVAATALHDLGPSARFHTIAAATELPDANGRLAVPLWLIGSGDPALRYKNLRGGIKLLRAGGVRSVPRVMVDAHAFSGPEMNPFWNAYDANEGYEVATSAVSIDEDTVEFHIEGTSPGMRALLYIEPPSRAVRWSGVVTTTAAGYGVDVEPVGPNTFAVRGYLGAGGKRTKYLPVHGLAAYVGAVADRMFKERGIGVARPAGSGVAPPGLHVLWDHPSPPLRQLVKHMLVHSDNHFAEQLLRRIGSRTGTPTDVAGIHAERAFLEAAHIPTEGLRLHDGSGLAHADRVSAWTLVRLLEYERGAGDQLYPLLARGGIDGTLRDYPFQAARGRVHAKSGHLDDVDSLAGYVDTRRHGRLTFAFLVEGTRYVDDDVVSVIDRMASL